MKKVLVYRELLEGATALLEQYVPFPTAAGSDLRAILAQPAEAEGR